MFLVFGPNFCFFFQGFFDFWSEFPFFSMFFWFFNVYFGFKLSVVGSFRIEGFPFNQALSSDSFSLIGIFS